MKDIKCEFKITINFFENKNKGIDAKTKIEGLYLNWDKCKEIIIKKLNKIIKYIKKKQGFQGFLKEIEKLE